MKNIIEKLKDKSSPWRKLKLVLFSVALLSLPWTLGSGFSGWVLVALVPLLILQDEREKGFLWWAALTFLLWIVATCWWVGVATPLALIMVPVVGMFFLFLPFAIWHRITKNAPKMLKWTLFVTMWICAEAAYTYCDINFPWLTLGNAFAQIPFMVQWYSLTGVFGGTLWILLSNILYFESYKMGLIWSRNRVKVPFWKRPIGIAGFVVMIVPIIASLVMAGAYDEKGREVKITIVQPNIDPYSDKFSGMTQPQQLDLILSLAAEAPNDVEYIVAPETSLDGLWIGKFDTDESVIKISEFLKTKYPSAKMVIGATTYYRLGENEHSDYETNTSGSLRYKAYNSALWIDSAAQVDIYHKSKLVTGAELLPYPAFFGFLNDTFKVDLGGFSGNMARSQKREIYNGTGTAVCYEALFSEYYTEYIKGGAEMMFIISNDGWWGNTSGHRGLLNISRLRAVETRRSIARSANTGISAFIDQTGELGKQLRWDKRGAITQTIRLNSEQTLYVRAGDYIVRLAFYVMILAFLYCIAFHFKKKR